MLNPTLGGNSIKYLLPELEMFVRMFFLGEYKGQPELVCLPMFQVSFVETFSSGIQDVRNIQDLLVAAESILYPLFVGVGDTCLYCCLHEPLVPFSWGTDGKWCNLNRDPELVNLLPDGLKPSAHDPFPILNE